MMKYLYLLGDYFIMLKTLDKLLVEFRCVLDRKPQQAGGMVAAKLLMAQIIC